MRRESHATYKFDDLVATINKANVLVSSLYQAEPQRWHASLRPVDDWSEWHGQGRTATLALQDAWETRKERPRKDWSKAPRNPSTKIERVRITRKD